MGGELTGDETLVSECRYPRIESLEDGDDHGAAKSDPTSNLSERSSVGESGLVESLYFHSAFESDV